MIKMIPPTGLSKEGEACFFCTVAVLKECIWRTRMEGLGTGSYISGPGLLTYFKYHLKSKIGLEKRTLSATVYEQRWKEVVKNVGVGHPN
uniref:Uncharacterized protein n=1 Tax=Octopus bimaculoides TaxID=37653 RepID=A0A0L8HND8_OCTBM